MSIKLSREMQLSRKEFMRELPKAIDQRPYQVNGDTITVQDGDRRVEITLIEEGTRDIGSLHLPMGRVELEFIGYGPEDVDSFLKRFDQHTLRLGGP